MKLLCKIFGHKTPKFSRPEVGGRNVKRCLRNGCNHLIEEEKVEKKDLSFIPSHRPTGRASDTWPKS